MFSIGRILVSLRSFPRNRRSRVGANPPRPCGPPLRGGDRKSTPPRRGAALAAGWVSPSRQTTPSASPITHFARFLACRRGAVALESAIAVIPLMICLVGVFEIVQTVFVRDLLQRAAYRTAYSNALKDYAAKDMEEMRSECLTALNDEVGGFLSFDLAGENGSCSPPKDGEESAAFCLKIDVKVYDKPTDMLNGTGSQGSNTGLGGDTGDMVVVTVVATSQSVLSQLQQGFFGDNGMTVTAVRRNERIDADVVA